MKNTNPLRKEATVSNTKANMAICNCTCYSEGENHEGGRSDSRWTFNLRCGCNCSPAVTGNNSANKNFDKDR